MKHLKVALAIAAIAAATGSAVATTHHNFSNKKWGRNPSTGLYIDITGQSQGVDYQCNAGSNVCTAEYPADVDPNNQAGDAHPGTVLPTNVVNGAFAQ